MCTPKNIDGLLLTKEGSACRVQNAHSNYLFVESTPEKISREYSLARKFTGKFFAEGCAKLKGLNEQQINDLLQEITMHWMYFYIINHLPIKLTEDDLTHPQTRRIIQQQMERCFGSLNGPAMEAAATFLDISVPELKKGMAIDEQMFADR